MSKIQEPQNQINKLQKELDELKKEEWPQKGDYYWYIASAEGIYSEEFEEGCREAFYQKREKNIFKSKENAKRFLAVKNKLHEISERFDPPDWRNGEQYKYLLFWNFEHDKADTSITPTWFFGRTVASSIEILEIVNQEIPQEDLRYYFRHLAGLEY